MTDYNWNGYGRQQAGRIDKLTGSLVNINEEHWTIHEGLVYQGAHKFTGVANGGVVNILLKVPAGVYPHLREFIVTVGEGDVDVAVYEGATVSADGTGGSILNMNRNSDNVSGSQFFHTPTITDDGTQIKTVWIPPTASGTGGSSGGISRAFQGAELTLKPNTNYLFRAANNSGATISIEMFGMIYELLGG